jgi:hypothetical protein
MPRSFWNEEEGKPYRPLVEGLRKPIRRTIQVEGPNRTAVQLRRR